MSKNKRCESPFGRCKSTSTKLYAGINRFNEPFRINLCDDHRDAMNSPKAKAKLMLNLLGVVDNFKARGLRSPEELHNHPAQDALAHHQDICDTCGQVRDWIAEHIGDGTVTGDQESSDTVGRYVLENCCPEGIRLNYQVGLVLAKLRA